MFNSNPTVIPDVMQLRMRPPDWTLLAEDGGLNDAIPDKDKIILFTSFDEGIGLYTLLVQYPAGNSGAVGIYCRKMCK